jgi:hypothetical protein
MTEAGCLHQESPIGFGELIPCFNHSDNHFPFAQTSPSGLDHSAIERSSRLVKARCIDQNKLSVGVGADAENTPASGLGLGRDDGDLLSNELVHEGRLADVGPAADCDKTCTVRGSSF